MEQITSWLADFQALITLICGLPIGAFCLFVFNWWQAKRAQDLASNTQNQNNQLQVNEQALKFYKEFIQEFKIDFQTMEKNYYAVREELIKLKSECECPKHDK